MPGDRVSISTASLNAASHIETAITSITGQTYPHIEHIIIDGGSTDGTLEIIERYRDTIGYFTSQPDRGIYSAMNKGSRQQPETYCIFSTLTIASVMTG